MAERSQFKYGGMDAAAISLGMSAASCTDCYYYRSFTDPQNASLSLTPVGCEYMDDIPRFEI